VLRRRRVVQEETPRQPEERQGENEGRAGSDTAKGIFFGAGSGQEVVNTTDHEEHRTATPRPPPGDTSVYDPDDVSYSPSDAPREVKFVDMDTFWATF
jgi:hypothetical protein